jgi:hypothetical protein
MPYVAVFFIIYRRYGQHHPRYANLPELASYLGFCYRKSVPQPDFGNT